MQAGISKVSENGMRVPFCVVKMLFARHIASTTAEEEWHFLAHLLRLDGEEDHFDLWTSVDANKRVDMQTAGVVEAVKALLVHAGAKQRRQREEQAAQSKQSGNKGALPKVPLDLNMMELAVKSLTGFNYLNKPLNDEARYFYDIIRCTTIETDALSKAISGLARNEVATLHKTVNRFGPELIAAAEAEEANRKKERRHLRMCTDIASEIKKMVKDLDESSLDQLLQAGPAWKMKREQIKVVMANTTEQWQAQQGAILEECIEGVKRFIDKMIETNFKDIFVQLRNITSEVDQSSFTTGNWETILATLQGESMQTCLKRISDVDLSGFDDEAKDFEKSRKSWLLMIKSMTLLARVQCEQEAFVSDNPTLVHMLKVVGNYLEDREKFEGCDTQKNFLHFLVKTVCMIVGSNMATSYRSTGAAIVLPLVNHAMPDGEPDENTCLQALRSIVNSMGRRQLGDAGAPVPATAESAPASAASAPASAATAPASAIPECTIRQYLPFFALVSKFTPKLGLVQVGEEHLQAQQICTALMILPVCVKLSEVVEPLGTESEPGHFLDMALSLAETQVSINRTNGDMAALCSSKLAKAIGLALQQALVDNRNACIHSAQRSYTVCVGKVRSLLQGAGRNLLIDDSLNEKDVKAAMKDLKKLRNTQEAKDFSVLFGLALNFEDLVNDKLPQMFKCARSPPVLDEQQADTLVQMRRVYGDMNGIQALAKKKDQSDAVNTAWNQIVNYKLTVNPKLFAAMSDVASPPKGLAKTTTDDGAEAP